MLRTALRPRWLALLALALVMATVFAALGEWQLGRAQRDDEPVAAPEPVPIAEVAAPQQQLDAAAVAGPVRVEGTWVTDDAVSVVDRPQDGRDGRWVVVPLEVATADGDARLAVVLGWVGSGSGADASAASARSALDALPGGTVDVVGRLQLSQEVSGPPGDLAADELRSLSAADLANRWGTSVYSGFLLASDAGEGLEAVPVPEADDGVRLVNLSYALQWWAFAAFAVFLWWRVVRDAHERGVEAEQDAATGETGTVDESLPEHV